MIIIIIDESLNSYS